MRREVRGRTIFREQHGPRDGAKDVEDDTALMAQGPMETTVKTTSLYQKLLGVLLLLLLSSTPEIFFPGRDLTNRTILTFCLGLMLVPYLELWAPRPKRNWRMLIKPALFFAAIMAGLTVLGTLAVRYFLSR